MDRAGGGRHLGLNVQIELFQCMPALTLFLVEAFGHSENDEQNDGEADAGDGCHLLRKQVHDRKHQQRQSRGPETDRPLTTFYMEIQWELVLLIVPLEAEYEN